MFASFSNQVDCVHQQIVIEIVVNLQQKVQADFAKGKGNYQSGNVEDEVFESCSFFLLNLHVAEGREVRSRLVVSEGYFSVNHFFGAD